MNTPPYIVSNWVRGDHFYGRTALCQALLASPERCIYLVGTRRVGKTSLLIRLAEQLHPHAIYCDLMQAAGSAGLDESRLVYLMRRRLQALAAHSAKLRDSSATWDRAELALVAWLEQVSWRWETLGLTMTLLWDEAEMLRRLPNATLMALRAILQHSTSLRMIVCASKGLAKINDHWRGEDVSPFLYGFKTEYLAGLAAHEADQLISQRGLVQVSPALTTSISQHTNQHPFLMQFLGTRLYSAGELRQPLAADLAPDPMLNGLFELDFGYLAPGEQAILTTLARTGPLNAADLRRESALTDHLLDSFLAGLVSLGMLRPAAEGSWQIANTFLLRWLRQSPQPAQSATSDQASLEVVAPPRSPAALLSERELAVLRLVAAGRSNPEIARELVIALDTVKAHLKHIFGKLETSNRAHAVASAKARGLL